jgi:hypothetical protein
MLLNASLSLYSTWNICVDPKHSFVLGVDDKEAPVFYFGMVIREDHVPTWGDLLLHYPLEFVGVRLSFYE